MDKKTITIVMCTFNGEKYLEEQIDSILSQTIPIYEIIIQDDYSTDSTWSIILRYKNQFPDLFNCAQNNTNIGYHNNFHLAISKAKGHYIAFADQDDVWRQDKLEILTKNIGDKLLIVSNSTCINSTGDVKGKLYNKMLESDFRLEKLIWGNVVYGHSCMVSSEIKKYFNKIDCITAHDYSVALISASLNSIKIIDQELQKWRRHDAAHTITFSKEKHRPKQRGIEKTFKAFISLLFGNKSLIITNGFKVIYNILQSVKSEKMTVSEFSNIEKIVTLMSKQTIFSYIKASFIYLKIQNTNLKNNHLFGLFYFTFVFRWWYDHQTSMS